MACKQLEISKNKSIISVLSSTCAAGNCADGATPGDIYFILLIFFLDAAGVVTSYATPLSSLSSFWHSRCRWKKEKKCQSLSLESFETDWEEVKKGCRLRQQSPDWPKWKKAAAFGVKRWVWSLSLGPAMPVNLAINQMIDIMICGLRMCVIMTLCSLFCFVWLNQSCISYTCQHNVATQHCLC